MARGRDESDARHAACNVVLVAGALLRALGAGDAAHLRNCDTPMARYTKNIWKTYKNNINTPVFVAQYYIPNTRTIWKNS